MSPQVGFVFLVASFITLHLDADKIFDEYAGPYEIKDIAHQHCPFKGLSCGNYSYNRQKIRGKKGEWDGNGSMILHVYVTDKIKLRVVASTKGLNNRYNSLLDFTQPVCKWTNEWLSDFTHELALNAGYKITDLRKSCYSLVPGLYKVVNFHFIQQKHLNISHMAPILPYGMYKFEFRVSEDKNPDCFCARSYFSVVPDAKSIFRKQQQANRKPFKRPTS